MNVKRMRGRNHRGSGGSGGGGMPVRHQTGNVPLNRNHVFDSSGPDLRIRGTSQQLFEKYLQLGRDATSSADRVMAESYFQHAEHYFRILNAMNQAAQAQGQTNGAGPQRRQPYESHGNEPQTAEQQSGDQDDEDDAPGTEASGATRTDEQHAEPREIPIATVPPEG